MQKVEGSSPFSRFGKARTCGLFCVASSSWARPAGPTVPMSCVGMLTELTWGRQRSARPASVRSHIRHAVGMLVLAVAYYAGARLGYALDFAGPVAAIVWLPVGVGISALYLGGLWLWPGLVLGDLLANDYGALPFGSALGQTTGNLLEMVAAAVLMRRLLGDEPPLASARGVARMLLALVAGTVVSATVGTMSLWLGEVVAGDQAGEVWRTWWLGDLSGALVVVPLALAWARPALPDGWRGGRLEAVAVMLATAGLTELAFTADVPLTYVVFPALIWASIRFGPRGATLAVALAVGLTVYDTTHYDGPFSFESITESVLTTQLYIAVSALSALCLAAVVSERDRFVSRLEASRIRAVEADVAARRRLQRDLHDGAQQRLTALAVMLGLDAADAEHEAPALAPRFEAATEEVHEAIEELRQLARGLLPVVLSDFGLAAALRDVAGRSPVPIRFAALPQVRLDRTTEATAYFVVLEAVTNAQKHALASSIVVHAEVNGHELRVRVADDGVGHATASRGSGLEGLRDRVEAIGGTLQVDSPAGGGTLIAARIPLSAT
jgi:signal transduction histidine kinase